MLQETPLSHTDIINIYSTSEEPRTRDLCSAQLTYSLLDHWAVSGRDQSSEGVVGGESREGAWGGVY